MTSYTKTTIDGTHFVNLTPHDLNVIVLDTTVNFPTSGLVARCDVVRHDGFSIAGIPVNPTSFGDVVGIPDSADNTFFIVSGLVKGNCNRHDVLAPGDLIRYSKSNPIGCKGLR